MIFGRVFAQGHLVIQSAGDNFEVVDERLIGLSA